MINYYINYVVIKINPGNFLFRQFKSLIKVSRRQVIVSSCSDNFLENSINFKIFLLMPILSLIISFIFLNL